MIKVEPAEVKSKRLLIISSKKLYVSIYVPYNLLISNLFHLELNFLNYELIALTIVYILFVNCLNYLKSAIKYDLHVYKSNLVHTKSF